MPIQTRPVYLDLDRGIRPARWAFNERVIGVRAVRFSVWGDGRGRLDAVPVRVPGRRAMNA
jgi:hypothetical protein